MLRPAACLVILASAISLAGCGGGASKPSAADREAAAAEVQHTASRIIDATDECLILAKVAPKKREPFCRKVRQLTSDLISELRASRDVLTAATISNTINNTLETQIGSACHECRKELSDARNELTGG